MVAGPPLYVPEVPAPVRAVAEGRPIRAVWVNELGGVTFEVGIAQRCFVKWTPASSGISLPGEAGRMIWAGQYTPVPYVLELGHDDDGSWLVTTALPGENAVSDRWRADPATAVRAIGEGLRAFHEALPLDDCPFSWTAEDRVEVAHERAAAGLLDPAQWDDVHRSLTVDDALKVVADVPAVDTLVVCHGDSCAPNTMLSDDGAWSGHVDLGSLGMGDRWADLAVATWSTEWNYGPGWERPLLDAYGVPPDSDRTRYYRLLWELGP